jgi:hypothetical protein
MTTTKQAYEWVKTGHWSLREFTEWFNSQQPSKPLTDEEVYEIASTSQDGISSHDDTLRFARAIETALNRR